MQKYQRLIIGGLILGLLVSIAITLLSDVSHLVEQALSFPWWLMLPVLGLRTINWTLRFIRWHFYLHLVGVRNLKMKDSAAVFLIGFPLSVTPGKVGEVVKSLILKNLADAPIATTLPVIAGQRVADGIAVLLLLAWAILNLAVGQYWPVVAVPLALFAVGIIILQIRPLCLRILDWSSHLPLIGKLAKSFELLYESSYKIVRLSNVLLAVGLGLAANVLDGVGVYLILVGLGQPATIQTFFNSLFVISLSIVTGSVSGALGGIGTSDLTIAGALLAITHLTTAEVGFATLLARFVQLWWGVLIGGLVAVAVRKRLFSPELERMIAPQSQPDSTPQAI